jgi:hypothetical protein
VTNTATLQVGSASDGAVSNAGTIAMGGGALNSGQITNTGTIVGFGTVAGEVLNKNYVTATNGTLVLSTAPNNNGGTLQAQGGNVGTLSVTPTWNNANGWIDLQGGVIAGAQLNQSGTLLASGGGTIASAGFRNTGTVNVTGTLTFFQAAGSVVTNDVGGVFTAGGTYGRVFATDGTSNSFVNAGSFSFNNGTIAAQNFVNAGAFNAAHSGTGTISTPVDGVFSNTSAGMIFVNSGTVMVNAGTFANQGQIDTRGSGVIGISGGLFVNGDSGLIINTNSAATLGIKGVAGSFANFGTIVVSNGATINMQNTVGTGNEWSNAVGGAVWLGNGVSAGFLNTGTINNSSDIIANNGTINLQVGSGTPRPIVQGASGQIIVTNGGDLTITHLASDRLSINGGTLAVGSGSTLRIYTDLAATTNAILLNGANVVLGGGRIVSANVTNSVSATIRGSGTLSFNNGSLPGSVSNLVNSGTILADNANTPLVLDGAWIVNQSTATYTATIAAVSGRLIANGVLTNQGTVSFLNSVGTFNSVVVNQGAWVTDPSTNVFNSDLIVSSSGSISAAAGDIYIFRSNFVNQSTQNTTYDTMNTSPGDSGAGGTKFIFDNEGAGGSTLTQQFFTAGLKLTGGFVGTPSSVTDTQQVSSFAAVTGFVDNFALDRLEIGNLGTNSIFELLDSFPGDGNTAALFVNDLWLFGSSQLILSNNTVLYFVNSNNWSLANVSLIGNAELHQLIPLSTIPEPSILILWASGVATIYASRRRRKKIGKRS